MKQKMMIEKRSTIFKPMMIMLILTGVLFGSIFLYKTFVSYMIKKSMSAAAVPPEAVSTMIVSEESWQSTITATGTLRAVNGVDLSSEVAGLVQKIKCDEGKDVKAGDVLVELNADSEIALLHSLEADAELAEINYKRDKAQFAIQGVSKATLDTDEATLKSKKALVEQQAAVIAKKRIRAPFDGKIGVVNVDLGQFLNPGENIVTLQSLDPIYAYFNITQQEFPKIKMNQKAIFTTDVYPNETFSGKITSMNPKVNVATRTIEVEATLANKEHKVLPGMYGVVSIATGSPKEYLTVSQAAISYNPYGDFVYILKEKGKTKEGQPLFIANQKFVTLGETRGDQVQVLKGLKKGDIIVTSGQVKLKNGSVVFMNNKIKPGNDPNPSVKTK